MKKPLLNLEDRLDINYKTYRGASLEFHLALMHLKRSIFKENNFFKATILWISVLKAKLN